MDYTLETLLEQLGVDGTDGLRILSSEHGKIPTTTLIADAAMWNEAQSSMLRESIESDGPWAPAVGQLDALLRG